MRLFPSLPAEPQLADVFRRFPRANSALADYHDRVLRDRSDLTVGERELIAAYVSGLNACTYCAGAHRLAAAAFGIDDTLFDGLMTDLATSAVDAKLKPILAYVRKLTLNPSRMVPADAQAVWAAGWREEALFDAIQVAALFNLMNRIVLGTGIALDPLAMPEADREARTARMAEQGQDPHEAPGSYAKLVAAVTPTDA